MYYLRQLRKYSLPKELLCQFYRAAVEPILCSSLTVWFGSPSQYGRSRLQRIVRAAVWITGSNLPSLQDLYSCHVRKRTGKLADDPSHSRHILTNDTPPVSSTEYVIYCRLVVLKKIIGENLLEVIDTMLAYSIFRPTLAV
ncbi:hypothetical protein SRHO_G00075800 [Serrasalmus rhombeus]